jgi:hypothetical protein
MKELTPTSSTELTRTCGKWLQNKLWRLHFNSLTQALHSFKADR